MLSGDPLLGGLTGSPAYLPLLDGSPAIGAGYPLYCPANDQAGTARPTGTACDLGAYEHEQNDWRTPQDCGLPNGISRNIPHHPFSLYITESTTYTLTSDCTVLGELRNELVAGESLTINGNGHTIYVPAGERFIYVGDGASLQISNVTISAVARMETGFWMRGCEHSGHSEPGDRSQYERYFPYCGGHVGSTVTATLQDITIVNSSPNSSLIRAWESTTMTITNGRFTNNHVPNAVVITHNDGSTITFEGCLTFANNTPRNTMEFLGNGTIVDNSTGPCDATATATPTATATATATPTPSPTPIPLGNPTNLTASVNAGGVTLNWTAPAGPVDGYEILRRRPLEGENQLQALVSNTDDSATTYTDTSATEAGVRYVYRVKAIRDGVRSDWSNFARV